MTELAEAPLVGHGAAQVTIGRRLLAELLGTGLLVMAVVGSGIMAQRLSPDDVGLQLLENAIATAGALVGLILLFASVSGAHFNPIVTLVDRLFGAISNLDAARYAACQTIGAILGALAANVMFERPAFELATKTRSAGSLWFSEVIATVGLLLVIHGCVRSQRADVVPFAVAAWIGGAYWFTSSTSFANPAVTIGRMFSDSFAGIDPASAPMFIAMQVAGAVIAAGLIGYLFDARNRKGLEEARPRGSTNVD